MKTQTIYICEFDNKRFDSEYKCRIYETLCEQVEKVMSPLGKPPQDMDEAIQHDITSVEAVLEKFLNLCTEVVPNHKSWFKEYFNGTRDKSHIGWLLSEYSSEYPCLYNAWFRFDCMNNSGIEYQQPYFVGHPNEFQGTITKL